MLFFDRCRNVLGNTAAGGIAPFIDEAGLGKDAVKALLSLNSPQYVLFPGFCDVHVHFREPGFFYKESIKTGTMAAARGGYTAVCTMPNLAPVPDCAENLKIQTDLIKKDALIPVFPYGAITRGQKGEVLSDMAATAPGVVGFSDDGHGVQSDDMMRSAMLEAKRLGLPIVAHCEDNSLLKKGGCVHDGEYARAHGLVGISSESEWRQIERDLRLAKETGCKYHVCHISTKESVELIRRAKADGVDVTCETAPHYLLLDDSCLEDNGRFKMNPPVRAREDRNALILGLIDGTIDMIATDHAPHSAEEKSKGLEKSAFGIVGLETAFPVLYTGLVETGILPLGALVERMSSKPRGRFSIPTDRGDFSIWDLEQSYVIDPCEFLSKGRSTPFAGAEVRGRCLLTVCGGRAIYQHNTSGR
ncbi:MAG: dihydroorotase [Oscillospiraceae bacterium]|nr:dihydroorotase [Oscillospiraceae bacterium]